MRIIVVGGAGTIGTAVVELLSARHDVVVAGRQSGDVQVDISSRDSVRSMYRRIGSFDALACAAGEAHFGSFETVTEEELALGVHSKLLGQIRLVLLGQPLISDGGSFTLMSGYIFDDPIPEATSFAIADRLLTPSSAIATFSPYLARCRRSASSASSTTRSKVPGSSNKCVAPGTTEISDGPASRAAATLFKASTSTSRPPTMSSVGTRTRSRASPAKSGRPPREITN